MLDLTLGAGVTLMLQSVGVDVTPVIAIDVSVTPLLQSVSVVVTHLLQPVGVSVTPVTGSAVSLRVSL